MRMAAYRHMEVTMPKYLFLLHHKVGAYDEMSPDQMQEIVTKHRQWVRRLHEAGAYVANEKLANDGRTLRSVNERLRVSDGPYVESKELIAGFYVVEATDYERAVELAQGCPVLALGVVEVREIVAG
jgi:hypothetical protein